MRILTYNKVMDYGYNYITFQRSRLQFIPIFFTVLFIGSYFVINSTNLYQVISVFITFAVLFVSFLYLYYLTKGPIVEIGGDAVTIKEIYHPFLKWRFIYKTHTFKLNSITNIHIKTNKKDKPKLIIIKYSEARKLQEIHLKSSDITDLPAFIKILTDKAKQAEPTYN